MFACQKVCAIQGVIWKPEKNHWKCGVISIAPRFIILKCLRLWANLVFPFLFTRLTDCQNVKNQLLKIESFNQKSVIFECKNASSPSHCHFKLAYWLKWLESEWHASLYHSRFILDWHRTIEIICIFILLLLSISHSMNICVQLNNENGLRFLMLRDTNNIHINSNRLRTNEILHHRNEWEFFFCLHFFDFLSCLVIVCFWWNKQATFQKDVFHTIISYHVQCKNLSNRSDWIIFYEMM